MFGTIHLLPDNYPWRTAAFDQAVAGSQGLIVETIVDNKNPQALAAELARLGFREGLPPLGEPGAAGKARAARGRDRQDRHSAPRL